MYLCASQRALLATATECFLCLSPSLISPHAPLSARHRMCLLRLVRRACALLSFPVRLFLVYLLLDTFYLACFREGALLPSVARNNSVVDSVDDNSLSHSSSSSSDSSSSLLSSPSSLPSSVADALSSPSSSSSSLLSSSLYENTNNSTTPTTVSDTVLSLSESELGNNSSSENIMDGLKSNNTITNTTTTTNSTTTNNSSEISHNNNNNHSGSNSINNNSNKNQRVSSYHAGRPAKEFPFALVVASSTAAVSILLFFCLSYIWHTRQLDRRAQKLAIRLAAESNAEVNCSQCRTPTTYMAGSSQDSGTDSCGEEGTALQLPLSPLPPRPLPHHPTALDELNSLNEEDEVEAEGDDGSRRKAGGVGRTLGSRRGSRGRGHRRSGSRSSRKWSGHSGGQNRSSLVTDQEILNHFASRRHSTFFI